jgi:hypothetical protein
VLHAILLSEVILEETSGVAESILQPEELLELRNMYTKLMNKEAAVTDTEGNPSLEKIVGFIKRKRLELLQ